MQLHRNAAKQTHGMQKWNEKQKKNPREMEMKTVRLVMEQD